MISLGVGKLKDEVVYTLAWRLTEVAAMADVLRFATLLRLIFVGVLSLPAQRRTDSDDCKSLLSLTTDTYMTFQSETTSVVGSELELEPETRQKEGLENGVGTVKLTGLDHLA
ncbi:hypothetical protein Tco_1167070 [Tanacetum coccineum]